MGASCSVFPDEAVLPTHPSVNAGSAGQGGPDEAGSSAGGQGNVGNPEGGVSGQLMGGSAGSAGSVTSLGGAGGEPNVAGGAGGEGGSPPCNNPQTVHVVATDDTWIGSAKVSSTHGSEKILDVTATAGDERRALIALTVPQMLLGAELRRAVLRLHLESNADAGKAVRRLGVHQLTSPFEEGRATWLDNVKKGQWTNEGGDFGSQLGSARIAAGTSSGNVDFNLTSTIEQILGPTPIPLSLIVLESTAARPAPAELAFTATEGNASEIPELLLTYCDP